MSEGNNGKDKPVDNKPKDTVVTIVLTSEGKFEVNGPGDGKQYNEMLNFYLLEKAKDFIKAHNFNANQSSIIKPKPNFINRVAGAFGGNR